jgi:hypothetical protein
LSSANFPKWREHVSHRTSRCAALWISGFCVYIYPPPSIYLFVPLAYLSFDQARIIATAISVAALLFSFFFILKILYYYGARLSKLEIVLSFVALFFFEPIANNLYAVNINLLLLFLITLFYYLFFVQKRTAWAGIILGVAAINVVFPVPIEIDA